MSRHSFLLSHAFRKIHTPIPMPSHFVLLHQPTPFKSTRVLLNNIPAIREIKRHEHTQTGERPQGDQEGTPTTTTSSSSSSSSSTPTPSTPSSTPSTPSSTGKKTKKVIEGDQASTCQVFGAEEVATFARLSTDTNPLHLDPAFARTTRFKRPIVHGILTASLLSAVVGNQLPGMGSIYMSQVLNFKKPVFVGDQVIAKVTVKKIQRERKVITLETICSVMRQKKNDEGLTVEEEEIVIDGEAVIYYPLLE